MKDSSSKSRLSDEGVRKKEPSVSKIEGKELSEQPLKATPPKAKINAQGTVKIKAVKLKLKNARSIKIKKQSAESTGKSPIMGKKTVGNPFVVKGSPKTESLQKEANAEKEKLALNKNVDPIVRDVEVAIDAFQISKVEDKIDTKKETVKVKVKKLPTEMVVCDLSSNNLLEKKNHPPKRDNKKDPLKGLDRPSAEQNVTRKGSSNKIAIVPLTKERRKRLSLKEEKLLLEARKGEKKAPFSLDKPTVSKEDTKVLVDSEVTILTGEDVKPVKKSRDRKQSFKARELSIQSIAKSASHATQKDNAPGVKLPKAVATVDPIPAKTKTENPKVNNTSSPEKKEPAEASSMIKFTYEKPSIGPDSDSPPEETTDSLPVLGDGLKSPARHKASAKMPETSGTEPVTEPATEPDVESQLQALEDGLSPGEKAEQALKEASATPVKTEVPEGFQPGARMEALEISTNKWYGVKVVEVDWAENEVLIHFEKWSQRFDEWIQMDSSRLRPCEPREPLNEKLYHVGETVMATWMNSQKYPAKVKKILTNDFLEVLFFDGFTKTMRTNKIAKCVGNEGLEQILPPPPPVLMSKLERRERKRKIQSVAELFHMKKKKYKTKKSNDLSVEAKADTAPDVEEKLSKKKHKYTDLTNISDNEGEKTYIDLNTSFTQEERETELLKPKDGNEVSLPVIPTKRPYKRKKLLNATADISSPESGTAKDGIFPFKGRKHNEAMGSDYDNWEPDGEEAYVVETADGLRRSLVVKDDRLPAGWAKHTIQRRSGNSAGKWDVFLVSPGGRRFRSRKEMQTYFNDIGEEYRPELFDFTLRCYMRRKCDDTVHVKPNECRRTKHLTLRKHKPTLKLATSMILDGVEPQEDGASDTPQRKYKMAKPGKAESAPALPDVEPAASAILVPEGTVLIGNLQVHVDPAGAYVCPSDSCSKHFRRENLLQMHIKHYHPELSAFVGSTPNVADLAYARTVGAPVEDMALSGEYFERLHRVEVAKKLRLSSTTLSPPSAEKKPADKKANKSIDPPSGDASTPDRPSPSGADTFARPSTSTPLRDLLRKDVLPPPLGMGALGTGAAREQPKAGVTAGIKTLLPIVRTGAKDAAVAADISDPWTNYPPSPSDVSVPGADGAFHKLKSRKRRLSDAYMDGLRKRKHGSSKARGDDEQPFSPASDDGSFAPPLRIAPGSMKKKNPLLSASLSRPLPDFVGVGSPELLGLRPGSGTPGNSPAEPMTEEQLNKRDIINCTCGVMEEDGLMIQCDLCLCWQHGYCNNIERENEVPDKYVCYICQHPARERMSAHYLHDQDWLNEGVLPSLSERSRADPVVTRRTALLRKSHDLAAGLLQLSTTIKSLRVKVNVANTPDHPKLYLWAKPWEKSPEPKMGHQCIEPHLLNHEDSSTTSASAKDGSNLAPLKSEGSNGQFVSDIGEESLSAPAVSGPNESGHKVSCEKETPKRECETSPTEVKEETEDAGNLGRECKTELESVVAVDGGETKPADVAEIDVKIEAEEEAAETVPKSTEESMDVDESKDEMRLKMEMTDPLAMVDAKQEGESQTKDSQDNVERQTQSSTPLMEGVASTSSQVPLIESSLQSKHFNTDKTGADQDAALLMQALTHGGAHEPALTNGTDLSNGHLDPSQLLNFPISKMELLRFANSIADNFKAAAVVNHSHPHAPEPEKPIDPRECRLLLLDHIELKQREVKQQLELLEDQLAVLEAEDPEPPGEETLDFFPQTKQTVKMLLRDLNTLKKISEIN